MIQIVTSWTSWLVFGFVLGILELLAPGFVFLGFGIGAAGVALVLSLAGPSSFSDPSGIGYLFVIWSITSFLSWLALRRLRGAQPTSSRVVANDINEAPYKGDKE